MALAVECTHGTAPLSLINTLAIILPLGFISAQGYLRWQLYLIRDTGGVFGYFFLPLCQGTFVPKKACADL